MSVTPTLSVKRQNGTEILDREKEKLETHDHFAFAEDVEIGRHCTDVMGIGTQPHQMVAQSEKLDQHHTDDLGSFGNFDTGQSFHRHDIGQIVGRAGQVVVESDFSAVHSQRWELVGKPAQRHIYRFPTYLPVHPIERFPHHAGIHLPAIQLDHVVEDFIDKPHGVDLPRLHRLLGEADQIALLVGLMGLAFYNDLSRVFG